MKPQKQNKKSKNQNNLNIPERPNSHKHKRKDYARSKELVPPFSMWSKGDLKIGTAGQGKFKDVARPLH